MNLPFKGYYRRKDAYEAADAGLVLWRKNFGFFILFFAIPFWICAFIFRLFPGKWMYLSWVFVWYLKPFFDRFILHVISIKFFEPEADIKRLCRGLGHNLKKGLLGDLLWRRFSPFRSATMPIRILEPQVQDSRKKSKKYKERKKLLSKGGLGFSFFLTFWGLSLEIALLIGEIIFFSIMARFLGIFINIFSPDFIIKAEIYYFVLWCINLILIETIYVCMGFSVYINSRIETEGWDLEIIFKNFAGKVRFAEKIKKKKIIPAVSLLCFLFTAQPAAVQEPSSAGNTEPPLELLEEIYASPEFGYEKDSWDIKLRNPPEQKERIISINYNRRKFMDWLGFIFASGLRVFIVISAVAAAIIIFVFARKYFKNRNRIARDKPVESVIHETLQENPQELVNKAVDFYNQGNIRNAWGYCAAAAILFLKLYRSLNFPPNATENDCIKIASSKINNTEEIEKFSSLIKTWINYAYAGRIPQEESFNNAVLFCRSFYENDSGNGNG